MADEAMTNVVTCFLTRNGKVLVLKRSDKVGTYRGRWAGVSGFVETADPLDQAWIELGEEVGISRDDATLERVGEPLLVSDNDAKRRYLVHPFRFSMSAHTEPRLDWEHVALLWVFPDEIESMATVPGLYQAWQRVS